MPALLPVRARPSRARGRGAVPPRTRQQSGTRRGPGQAGGRPPRGFRPSRRGGGRGASPRRRRGRRRGRGPAGRARRGPRHARRHAARTFGVRGEHDRSRDARVAHPTLVTPEHPAGDRSGGHRAGEIATRRRAWHHRRVSILHMLRARVSPATAPTLLIPFATCGVAGLLLGGVTLLLQGILPGVFNHLANSGAVWSVGAFVTGALLVYRQAPGALA